MPPRKPNHPVVQKPTEKELEALAQELRDAEAVCGLNQVAVSNLLVLFHLRKQAEAEAAK